MKSTLTLLFSLALGVQLSAQIVSIPDPAFKNYLIGQPSINLNGDAEIQVSEANAFTGTIGCFNMGIYDLTGIEAFTNVTTISVPMNNLTSLDVSQNTQLEILICPVNDLTSLDVSNNLALRELVFSENNISSIDVTNNLQLTRLEFYSNSLTSIDILQNTLLEWFDCSGNTVGNIDFSIFPNLSRLVCNGASMTSLDVTNNPQLTSLELMINDVSLLDLSSNTQLEYLRCDFNDMSTLDLSMCPDLYTFGCFSCDSLLTVDIANGNNTNITNFQVNNSPNVECIKVDDVAYSVSNWTSVDDNTVYSLSCSVGLDHEAISEVSISPNPFTDELTISSEEYPIESVRLLNTLGQELFVANPSLLMNSVTIDGSLLPSGVYTIIIVDQTGRANAMSVIRE